MIELSATAGYALLAMGCLETVRGRWVLAREIAVRTQVAAPYLSRILHTLVKAGLVLAKRGYRGGFRLARPGQQVRITEIVEAIERRSRVPRCLLGMSDCSDQNGCPVHALWKAARTRVEVGLNRLTLAEFARAMPARSSNAPVPPAPTNGNSPPDRTPIGAPWNASRRTRSTRSGSRRQRQAGRGRSTGSSRRRTARS